MTNYEQMAEQMYSAYCQQAGGLTFDGKPLPSFQELGLERQSCWRAAAEASCAQSPTPAATNEVTVLPDGSAFAVYSYPLPKDHWLYAPREYEQGAEEPKELAAPILTHAAREQVVSAIRYAVRAATDCGKETDFDPDALVQNAVYALCGPFNKNQPQPQADATTPQGLRECCEHLNAAGHAFWAACALEADGGAVRWVKYADGSLIVFTRGEYKDQIMSALGGLYSAPTKVFEHHSDEFERETQAFEATDKQRVDALDAKRYRLLRDEWLNNEPEAINMERAKGQRGLDAAIDAAIVRAAAEIGECHH